nr:MAG TPA: hypothetical protein [Caudoviricetes sp.]
MIERIKTETHFFIIGMNFGCTSRTNQNDMQKTQ